jgi:hypothetical protein
LFFVKTDLSSGQICSTDGTVAGTQFEARSNNQDFGNQVQSTQAMSVVPLSLYSFNNALYFKAQFALGQPTGLWRLNFPNLSSSIFTTSDSVIYPNPTTGIINVRASENIKSISVFDILGKQISNKDIHSNDTQIDITNYNAGIYYLKIFSENGVLETKKIIKN